MGITSIEEYFTEGCGRCKHHKTPQCKIHLWPVELQIMRELCLESGLKEELKWSQPVYSLNGKNVVIIAVFKNYCAMGFFKGVLMSDPHGLLSFAGENSNSSKMFRIEKTDDLLNAVDVLREYLREAIEVEKSGAKIAGKAVEEYDVPQELTEYFESDSDFEKAFKLLTPGRQRAYLMHFNQAKQSKTRLARIEKYRDKIFAGKGFME
ncbi:MAG: YdeI/OmpD-associated family protein [Bacteroidia bacterium]|nr:YdeI/OmpD-associated family protein [Bacteroidia bacterium]